MQIVQDGVFNEAEATEFIKLKILQDQGIDLSKDTINLVLGYELDYMIEKGLAVPMEDDEE